LSIAVVIRVQLHILTLSQFCAPLGVVCTYHLQQAGVSLCKTSRNANFKRGKKRESWI